MDTCLYIRLFFEFMNILLTKLSPIHVSPLLKFIRIPSVPSEVFRLI